MTTENAEVTNGVSRKGGKAAKAAEAAATKKGAKKGAEKAAEKPPEAVKPAVAMQRLKAPGVHETVLVPLSDLVIDQSKNNRTDPVDLKNPEPKFIMLAESIRRKGLLHDVSVKDLGDGKYEVVAGYRRAMAHHGFECALSGSANLTMQGSESRVDNITIDDEDQKITFDEIPMVSCKVVDVENDYDVSIIRGIENLNREELGGYETAKLVWDAKEASIKAGFGQGKEKGFSLHQIGRDLHISRSHATNLWRTRALIPGFMKPFRTGALHLRDAIRYCGMTKEEQQKAFEVWENRGGGGKEEGEGGGGGSSDKRMLSKNKVEALLIEAETAIQARIGGKFMDVDDEKRKIIKATIKFIYAPPEKGDFFRLPEEEEEEADDE